MLNLNSLFMRLTVALVPHDSNEATIPDFHHHSIHSQRKAKKKMKKKYVTQIYIEVKLIRKKILLKEKKTGITS